MTDTTPRPEGHEWEDPAKEAMFGAEGPYEDDEFAAMAEWEAEREAQAEANRGTAWDAADESHGTTLGTGASAPFEPTLADLACIPRWVAWQGEERSGRSTKVLKNPQTGENASATAPATWSVRATADDRAARLPKPCGVGGVGLVLGDHGDLAVGGIDLDTCRGPVTHVLEPWAVEVVDRFASYTEVSPSGTGVKVFFTFDGADMPALTRAMGTKGGKVFKKPGATDHPPAIEVYLTGRYFAVTEQHRSCTPLTLRRVPLETLMWLLTEAGPGFAGTKPKANKRPNSADGSRSALAFSIACRLKKEGGDYDAFIEALEADPRTADWLEEKGKPNGGRELRRAWERADPAPGENGNDVELTEDGVARAFTAEFHQALRYCHDTGGWHVWTDSHWKLNRDRQAFSWARALARKLNRNAEFKTKAATGKASFAAAVEKFAQADRVFAVTADTWDRDLFLIATPAGTVDLRTGKLRPAERTDYVTKTVAVAPAETVECPAWLAFLKQATADDADLIRFLQQWSGYCLTGSAQEHALLFIYGPGGNGKSVFLNTLAGILADYMASAAMDTFTSSPNDKHPTDLAMLRGARLVTATETEEGRAWAEARIKQMTGGDPISARFMRQDFFTYTPQFKLTIAGNHKPLLKNVDDAARRRFNIVPFLHKPLAPDHRLESTLKAEWPGILRWMIEGCLDWQENGLVRPKIVRDATVEYFDAQDTFGQWLAECCEIEPTPRTKPAELLASYTAWCHRNGEVTPNRNKMRGMLERVPGLRYATNGGAQWVRGIRLKPIPDAGGGGGVEAGGGYPH